MGEMKVEHVLLFLVGAFLVYHMMGKCRGFEGLQGHWPEFDEGCIKKFGKGCYFKSVPFLGGGYCTCD